MASLQAVLIDAMFHLAAQCVESLRIAARPWTVSLALSVAAVSHAASVQDAATFDCRADNGHCPELLVVNDPSAQVPGFGPAPFRGFGDPSLRRDPKTGVLWLSYSWVSTLIAPTSLPGKPVIDVGVGIHLARSDDNGRTFQFVRTLWRSERETYEGTEGYSGHEVSTISPARTGWAALDLRYFNPRGNGNDFKADSFHFEYLEGIDLEHLDAAKAANMGGPLTAGVWRASVDLSRLAGVAMACPVWTEPSLFEDAGVLYLLAQCKTPRNPVDGYLGLFARQATGWRWVGCLTMPSDASALGGNELTQADLARGRDGSLLLLVTPNLVHSTTERHLGCVVLAAVSLDPPRLMRDASGAPTVRARISSSDSMQNGPGACAYDPSSETGVLIVRRVFSPSMGVVFSIHSTGVRP